jgi:glycosyltransferase involved in cell wall biosynthesis
MRIAIDSSPLNSGHKVRGVGMYVSELIRALGKTRDEKFKIEPIELQTEGKMASIGDKFNLLHFTSFNPFIRTLPSRFPQGVKVVVTVHDLIPLIYSDVYQPGIRGWLNFIRQKKILNKVDAIIVPSETSKKDVVKFIGVSPEKIYVIYEGAKQVYRKINDSKKLESVRKKYNLPDKFVLYVGDVNFNKNIMTLVKACVKIKTPLVICGKQALEVNELGMSLMNLRGPRDYFRFLFNIPHPEQRHFFELSDAFEKNEDLVYRIGFIPDNDLAAIFNLASVYVQPSLYEGFGLSVVEAFASETPVVIAKTNCLVEIAGNAALFVDPEDVGGFSKKIEAVLKNRRLRVELVERGKERVKTFSWDKCARETMDVYKKVLATTPQK